MSILEQKYPELCTKILKKKTSLLQKLIYGGQSAKTSAEHQMSNIESILCYTTHLKTDICKIFHLDMILKTK